MARIAINAQIAPGVIGGTANFLLGLIYGLGQLQGGEETFTIIGTSSNETTLKGYMGPNQQLVCVPDPVVSPAKRDKKRIPKRWQPFIERLRRRAQQFLLPPLPKIHWPEVPISDGFYEKLGCDFIHFPYQGFVLSSLPSIYQPWDLQHRHYPQFFTPGQIAWREVIFPGGCRLSTAVVVASRWIKQDVVQQYNIHPDKIRVVPVAAPLQAAQAKTAPKLLREKYALPQRFMLFPAVTWPHKNHIRLIEAMARLRDHDGLDVNLVCTGTQQEFWATIEQRIHALNLQKQVCFLGHIDLQDLRALYHEADFVVFPSLFEGAGMPPLEAWAEGKAVACSNATSLPEIVGEAAILFDPLNVDSIANAVKELYSNQALRNEFERRGMERLKRFSWERTARIYRALYRQILKQALTEEDTVLLGETL